MLERLALRPTLVGVERDVLKAALEKDVTRTALRLRRPTRGSAPGQSDAAGTWLVPLATGPEAIGMR